MMRPRHGSAVLVAFISLLLVRGSLSIWAAEVGSSDKEIIPWQLPSSAL
jgi:hypothetical protein